MNELSNNGLQALHKQWAIWATRKLRLIHPELALKLYGTDWNYVIHVASCEVSEFPELAKYFDNNVCPMTCNVRLSQDIPLDFLPIEEIVNYEAELWLNGAPLSVRELNDILFLAEQALPNGGIDFNNNRNVWEFRSLDALTNEEKDIVKRAAKRVGIIGTIHFVDGRPQSSRSVPTPIAKKQGDLNLITSRQLASTPDAVRDLVHQDEDEWREFLSHRAKQEIMEPDLAATSSFACLYDVEHCGDSRLSELLTIYDRVDIMPQRNSLNWFSKHQVPLADLQELVRLKRVRVILPNSATDYPPTLLEAVAEVDRSSIVLSRALAAKTITQGQMKEPLLYAPLTSPQRAEILSVMSNFIADENRGLLDCYGHLFSMQHDVFMMRGALASLGFGVGAYLGEVFLKLGNKDARIELMTCGAGIEWALGLGSTYIPRDFGGYDETWNSHIIASYLGRTQLRPSDPVANRMHIVSDGLLAVSGIPPLEVARNLNSLKASRFRKLARHLMASNQNAFELQEAVDQINSDVNQFESRAERLASWKISIPLSTLGVGYVEHSWPIYASAGAAWLCGILKDKLPEKVRGELADVGAMLTSVATASSLDAAIVSRSRKAITKHQ